MQQSLFDPPSSHRANSAPTREPRRLPVSATATVETLEQQRHREQVYQREFPRLVRNIKLGTAGWTDPTLLESGHFYPPHANSAESRLRHYAKHFAMVEVDTTYYALPTASMAHKWVERTPEEFVFDVKAFSLLTGHAVDVARLPKELQREVKSEHARVAAEEISEDVTDACFSMFLQGIAPIHQSGRLGSVLLQFPPWMDATKKNAAKIERVRERLSTVQVSVEFRHRSWGESQRFARVLDWLRDLRASYVCVDEPQGFVNSMPPIVAVADPRLAVVRFHGRRTEHWNRPVSVQEKYNYLYTAEELRPWAAAVQKVSEHAEVVHAVFNNCRSDYAVIGAKDMTSELLEL